MLHLALVLAVDTASAAAHTTRDTPAKHRSVGMADSWLPRVLVSAQQEAA